LGKRLLAIVSGLLDRQTMMQQCKVLDGYAVIGVDGQPREEQGTSTSLARQN
jgi:hypothetical protein